MTTEQHGGIKKYPGHYRYGRLGERLVLIAGLTISAALPALAQIQGSAHDFSSYSWSDGEVCAVCHLPHTREVEIGLLSFRNHEISTAIYTLYSSVTLKQIAQQLDSANFSRLCLSCHDGTIALDSFGGNQGVNYMPAKSSLGTDLSDDHPVGVSMSNLGNGASVLQENGVKLYDGNVECPSCHDVHNDQVDDENLLRVSRVGSQLCFQCHDK